MKIKRKVKIKFHKIKNLIKNFYFSTDINNAMSIVNTDRHFKIKKNKSDIESLPKEEVIHCSCGSNQEDGLMIQVILNLSRNF